MDGRASWLSGCHWSFPIYSSNTLCYPLRWTLREIRLKKYCRSVSMCTFLVNILFLCVYKWECVTSFSIRKGHNLNCSGILLVGQNVPCSSGAACKQHLFLLKFKDRKQSLLDIKNFLCTYFAISQRQVSFLTKNLMIHVLAGWAAEWITSVLKQWFCRGKLYLSGCLCTL